MDLGVRGKGYVVVGGTAGMGLAAARALAREGASVVVVGRDAERGKNAAEELVAAGAASAHSLAFDVSQSGAAVVAVDEAVRILGRLDGIAITMGTAGMMPIDSDDDAWDSAFHDVLLATTRSVQAALPHLAVNGGAIVTVKTDGVPRVAPPPGVPRTIVNVLLLPAVLFRIGTWIVSSVTPGPKVSMPATDV